MKKLILFGLLVVVLSSCIEVQVRESVYVTVEPIATDLVPTVNAATATEERRLKIEATVEASREKFFATTTARAVEATQGAEIRDRTVFDSFGSASFRARMMNLRGYDFIWEESISGYWYDSVNWYGFGIYPEGRNKDRDVGILMATFILENGTYRDYQADGFEKFLVDLGFPSSFRDELYRWMARSDDRHIYTGDDQWTLLETVGGYSIASVHDGVDDQGHVIKWLIIISE